MRDQHNEADHTELQPTLELILRNAVGALGGSAGVVAIWDRVEGRFIISASHGMDARELARLNPLLGEAIPDLAGSREQFTLLSRLEPGALLPHSEHGDLQDPVIALPLSIGEQAVGLMYVLRPLGAVTFSKLDPPVLAAFAEQVAIALQNARLAHVLAQEKQRMEALLEGSADGIISIDAQRRIVGINSAIERLLGRPRQEVLGQQCAQVLNLRDWEGRPLCPDRCPMLMRRQGSGSIVELQGRVQQREGRDKDVAMLYSIVYDADGQPLNAVVNIRDITRVRETESLRSMFLAMLGHELQTPLSIIKGYANTLVRQGGRWEELTLRQGLQVIEEESDRLSQLISRLLLASRLEGGALTLQREPVQLAYLTQKVVDRIEAMATSHVFTVDFPPGLPTVSADPALLEEVLINLVDNAVKYSPQGGDVFITGQVTDTHVSVTVADQGIGVPPWEAAHLFERFSRGTNEVTQTTRGMGLGLYVCHSIVTAHGGRMEVTSEMKKGSQFTFVLPRE